MIGTGPGLAPVSSSVNGTTVAAQGPVSGAQRVGVQTDAQAAHHWLIKRRPSSTELIICASELTQLLFPSRAGQLPREQQTASVRLVLGDMGIEGLQSLDRAAPQRPGGIRFE